MKKAHFPLRPALDGQFAARFCSKTSELATALVEGHSWEGLVGNEVSWALNVAEVNPQQRKVYRAVWLLLRDLVHAGWTTQYADRLLYLTPPGSLATNDPERQREIKSQIRASMHLNKMRKIAASADFVRSIENGTRSTPPISELFADGKELSDSLSNVKNIIDESERRIALAAAVRPYLQIVSESKCDLTGIRLGDIWRYCRLTWSTPYEQTPGRTIQYLVRDEARKNHPIIGISQLENSPLVIGVRDRELGWAPDSYIEDINIAFGTHGTEFLVNSLLHLSDNLSLALSEIDLEGLATPGECETSSDDLILRLASITAESARQRQEAIDRWYLQKNDDSVIDQPERSEMGNLSKDAVDAMYRRKRSERVSRLLLARREFKRLLKLDSTRLSEEWQAFIIQGENRQNTTLYASIRTALQAAKARHIGTSIMEMNVCGAMPPYSDILGGKLVALLMLSPQVVAEYRQRYGEKRSEIASKMKGQDVRRPAELLFLGTTSLYHVGSSQYNRLKLPEGLMGNSAEVRWKRLGETSGYGTLHISADTIKALEEASEGASKTQFVNHIFGEGSSPKMRALRQGLDTILGPMDSESKGLLIRHEMKRIVYGAWLTTNGSAILGGIEEPPDYYFDAAIPPAEGTERIATFWRQRWLDSRINSQDVLDSTGRSGVESPIKQLLTTTEESNFEPIVMAPNSIEANGDTFNDRSRAFVRNLYRGSSLFADGVSQDILSAIHVPTRLDDAIFVALSNGKSVVLTGNPGDGKTHLLRILQSKIAALPNEPILELDASTLTSEEIKKDWESANASGRPFCVAINEGVLKALADDFPDFNEAQVAQRQVIDAVGSDIPVDLNSSIIVFDLSRRNILDREIVDSVINCLAKTVQRCSNCPSEGCDVVANKTFLDNETVRDRLQAILSMVTLRGFHITLRELQNFISYLLFAGRDCSELLLDGWTSKTSLSELVFSGEGRLFSIIRENYDPARFSHPIWDECILNGEIEEKGWVLPHSRDYSSLNVNQTQAFQERKRAFYFFHEAGSALLNGTGGDELEFQGLFNMPERDRLKLIIRRLNTVFGSQNPADSLTVWQSHRFNQSPRRILYSSTKRLRTEFKIEAPKLSELMRQGFELAENYLLLSLKTNPSAHLKIDFELFQLLTDSSRGVPVLALDSDTIRRVWQFMDSLANPTDLSDGMEKTIHIYDQGNKEGITVTIDTGDRRYLSISGGEAA